MQVEREENPRRPAVQFPVSSLRTWKLVKGIVIWGKTAHKGSDTKAAIKGRIQRQFTVAAAGPPRPS